MILHINFVEYEDEWKLHFVKDRASVEHVWHESGWRIRSRGVDDISDNSRERRGNSIGDDGSRGRPGEYFDLSRSIKDYITSKEKYIIGVARWKTAWFTQPNPFFFPRYPGPDQILSWIGSEKLESPHWDPSYTFREGK